MLKVVSQMLIRIFFYLALFGTNDGQNRII